MEQRTSGRDQLPPLPGRRDVETRTGQQSGAAFRLLRFPEPFEILANSFDAKRHTVREFPRPSDARDQIQRVALRDRAPRRPRLPRAPSFGMMMMLMTPTETMFPK
jgi:hypothetical protein